MHPTKKYMTYTTSFELKMIYEKYLYTGKIILQHKKSILLI